MKKVVALLLAVAMCACLCAHGEGEQPNESQSIPSTGTPAGNESEPGETTTPATESASFTSAVTESVSDQGDDLADLVVSIDGSVYQLPCTVQLLLDDGWQLTSDDQLRTKEKQIRRRFFIRRIILRKTKYILCRFRQSWLWHPG